METEMSLFIWLHMLWNDALQLAYITLYNAWVNLVWSMNKCQFCNE